jgi:hypothetical protein
VESIPGFWMLSGFCLPEPRRRPLPQQDRGCRPDDGDYPQLRCDVRLLQSGRRAASCSCSVKSLGDARSPGRMSDRERQTLPSHCEDE